MGINEAQQKIIENCKYLALLDHDDNANFKVIQALQEQNETCVEVLQDAGIFAA